MTHVLSAGPYICRNAWKKSGRGATIAIKIELQRGAVAPDGGETGRSSDTARRGAATAQGSTDGTIRSSAVACCGRGDIVR